MSATIRVADVFRKHWREYDRTNSVDPQAVNAVRHILQCRTAELGGHLYQCKGCGSEVPVYNSCLDRHCPTCQTVRKLEWLEARQAELLPVQYFHTVFTLPHQANPLVDCNRELLLNELFHTSSWVLQSFAADPQWRLEGSIGFIAMLHTWNQLIGKHFHMHCIVPGGVWRENTNEWVSCRTNYLFKKSSLADAFRNRYCKRLRALHRQGKLSFTGPAARLADQTQWNAFITELENISWAVWPKPTAGTPSQALDYLGRYTHRVAISDHRILKFQDGNVTFSWRDRSDDNKLKTRQIPAKEFIKRFLYHILPQGFQKIRYYGWLSPTKKKKILPLIRNALNVPEPVTQPREETTAERILRLTGVNVSKCPCCGKPKLAYVAEIPRNHTRAPP